MKKFTIQAIFLLVVIAIALFIFQQGSNVSNLPFFPQDTVIKQLDINNNKLKVEIADTQAKRSKGLGGRTSLASDEGMLFIFDKTDKYSFWMKGLTFPLDFVWIRDNRVVDVLSNVQPAVSGQPDSSLPIYESKETIDKVLEINAGTIQRLNIKVGDTTQMQ